jgi:prevent-host-death family protein
MKATVLDLRRKTRAILAALDRNERVTLTNRGRKTAVIVPLQSEERPKAVSHNAFGIWKDRKDMSDVDGYVRALRKGRSF